MDSAPAIITFNAAAPVMHTVTFDAGLYGSITEGQQSQLVDHGSAAIAPTITATATHTFTGWDVAFDSITEDLTVTAQYTLNALVIERGIVAAANSTEWQTISLNESYDSPVIVTTPACTVGTAPAMVRLQNVTGTSFDIKLAVATDSGGEDISCPVHYFVVEEGVYTAEFHGVSLEAVTYTSTVTDGKDSWNGEAQVYRNSYTSPVVLGQVLTSNDPRPSVFWARGSSQGSIPSATELYTGKHVGEDTIKTRVDETIGYVVFESGAYTLNGFDMSVGVGPNIVDELTADHSDYYDLTSFANPISAVLSASGINGSDGGWPVLYGSQAFAGDKMNLAFVEDTWGDSDQNHANEEVSYIAFYDADLSDSASVMINSGAGGSISPSGTINIENGQQVTFTIIPDEGYLIEEVTYNGASEGTSSSYTVSGVTGVHTLEATFVLANVAPVAAGDSVTTDEDTDLAIALNATDDDNDPLVYSYSNPSHGMLSGIVPNLIYTPDTDYSGTDSFTFSVNDGTVDSNTATVSITVNSVNDLPDSVLSIVGDSVVNQYENVTLEATASDSDGEITKVVFFDGVVELGELTEAVDGVYRFVWAATTSGIHQFTAVAYDNLNGTTISAPVDVSVTPVYSVTFKAGSQGTFTGGGAERTQQVVSGASAINPQADLVINQGYIFNGWDVSFDSITLDLTVTATYEQIFYSISTSDPGNGTVTLPGTSAAYGSEVNVSITPDQGYRIKSLAINGILITPVSTYTVSSLESDLNIDVEFELDIYELTFESGDNGRVIGAVDQTVNAAGTSTAVKAVPDAGYVFSQWSDGALENPRVLTGVDENTLITAEFIVE